MRKLDCLSRCCGREKSGIDAQLFNPKYLRNYEDNDTREEVHAEYMDLEEIKVETKETKNKV